jgi:hypothetical protein
MERELHHPICSGFDLGAPEGDQACYFIPPSAEAVVRQFFGGALPDWIVVLARLPASETIHAHEHV